MCVYYTLSDGGRDSKTIAAHAEKRDFFVASPQMSHNPVPIFIRAEPQEREREERNGRMEENSFRKCVSASER